MYLGRGRALLGMVHGGVKRAQIRHTGNIVSLYHAMPESGDRAKLHDRATENDDRAAKRVEGPKGIRTTLDTSPRVGARRPRKRVAGGEIFLLPG